MSALFPQGEIEVPSNKSGTGRFGRLLGIDARMQHLSQLVAGKVREEVAAPLQRELAELREELRQARALIAGLTEAEIGQRRNVQTTLERHSVQTSAELARQHMIMAASFGHPAATLSHALSLAPRGGLALEFGVFSGSTLRLIAEARSEGGVYGFDSFQGLPEAWRGGFPAGAFAVSDLPQVPGAELVVGWFDAVLPGFLEAHPGPVDFVHIDCDLYSSTRTVLELLGPRLRPGTVVMFDEYFNYPGWEEHEHKAWVEYAARTGLRFTYEAYTFNNEQVAIRIIE